MDLLGLMKDYIAQPDVLVNVKQLSIAITVAAQGLTVDRRGDEARRARRARGRSAKRTPRSATAAASVGTPQIRNAATVGGNLMQRPRCWYFRNEEFNCLKKGGARCFAVDGENQFHAIFGDGPCHIVHPSTPGRCHCIAYGARIKVAGPDGERESRRRQVLRDARSQHVRRDRARAERARHRSDVLPARRGAKSALYEVKFKQAHDWPIAMAAVALRMNGATCESARVVLGAVAPVPWRSMAAEAGAQGQGHRRGGRHIEAAEAALADAKPMSGNAYKVQVAKTALRRAIMKAMA